MNVLYIAHIIIVLSVSLVNSAVILNDGDVEKQGLYSESDHVSILTQRNFDRKVYNQRHALLVQFYNSYCGHCRAFAPKFKSMAIDINAWQNIIKLAVIDCSVEENIGVCREFEVMAYPSIKYLHENYIKGNGNTGENFRATDTAEKLKTQLIRKMQEEQSMGRLSFAPSLKIASYLSYTDALNDVPIDTEYTFLIFENQNSTIGSEIILDMNDYNNIKVKRVFNTSELVKLSDIKHFPGIVAVSKTMNVTPLTPKIPSKPNLMKVINTFLKSRNYDLPIRDINQEYNPDDGIDNNGDRFINSDTVYYSDLEKTIKISLHTEITRHKILKGEPLYALFDYLDALITSFPFRGNLKEYIVNLRATLNTKQEWNGSDVYELVKELENSYAPVYVTNLEYFGCKGSQPKYRGYTCGLWTLFHSLTVNAAQQVGLEGPKVLKAMHGYVKHFFGCTECSDHFQEMATRNRLFDVKENDKAVLWLWISHNEVNLRLAGDITEDPKHPKIQFPSVKNCPECRLSRGAWNLPAVYDYLKTMYSRNNIQDARRTRSAISAASPFSNLDIGMLSLLYLME